MTSYLSFSLPPDDAFPAWTEKLIECQRVGDSYRGYVTTSDDLEGVLLAHSRQTGTTWSTRQTAGGLGNPSSRIMWKSQYAPYDGTPFINKAQRAVVMECQLGRTQRKHAKRETFLANVKDCPSGIPALTSDRADAARKRQSGKSQSRVYVSCPATVTIKEVKKFPMFAVSKGANSRQQRRACEKSVRALRELGVENVVGETRWYMQLPTEKAHEFHEMDIMLLEDGECKGAELDCELDPRVSEKVRELVTGGLTECRLIQLAISKFVVDEIFGDGKPPLTDDLRFFPSNAKLRLEIVAVGRELEKQRLATMQLIGSQRMDARVLMRLRQLVVQGVTEVLEVKHAIKDFVEKELFAESEERPDMRDRAFYPTVIDIQNHLRVTQETTGNESIVSTGDVFAHVGATAILEGLTHDEEGATTNQPVVYVPMQWLVNASHNVNDSQSMVLMPTISQWQLGGHENQVNENQQQDDVVDDSRIVSGVNSGSETTTLSSTPVSEEDNFVSMDADNLFSSTALTATCLGVNIPSLDEFANETVYSRGSIDDSDLISGCDQTLPLVSDSSGTSMFSVSDRVVTSLSEMGDVGVPIRDVSLVQHDDMTPITSPRTFSPTPGDGNGCTDTGFMNNEGLGTGDVVSGFYETSDGFGSCPSSQSDILRL